MNGEIPLNVPLKTRVFIGANILANMPIAEIDNDKIKLEIKYWREKYPPEDKPILIKYLADRFYAEINQWIQKNIEISLLTNEEF